MRRLLEYQANQIEIVLASHKISSRVIGGTVTPRFVQFHLAPSLGTRIRRIKSLREEIALSLGASSCRIFRKGGLINIELPREDAKTVKLLPLMKMLPRIPPCTAVLGIDEGGTPLLVMIPSPDVAHILIAGMTGCGKTELARTMIASLAMKNRLSQVQIALIDPKGRGFSVFDGLPHLLFPVLEKSEEILSVLKRLVKEMERRDEERVSEPRIVIFIDELSDLLLVGGKEMGMILTRLIQRGRGAGIHLVACTQKPMASTIGSLVKSNFPVRIVGSVTSPEDAKVASGISGTGAEKLLGRGDFLLVTKGQTLRFSAAYISQAEIREIISRFGNSNRAARNRSHKRV
jgi:S-DNA-T family DNA segregation ATPase FtsK/SpoIIIE